MGNHSNFAKPSGCYGCFVTLASILLIVGVIGYYGYLRVFHKERFADEVSGKSPAEVAEIARNKGRVYGLKILQYKQSAEKLMNEANQAAQEHNQSRAALLQKQIRAVKHDQDRTEAEGFTWAQSLDPASRNIFMESYQQAQSGK